MSSTKLLSSLLILVCVFLSSASYAFEEKTEDQQIYDEWLKERFSDQHEALIPIVAVADMFYACNKEKNTDKISHNIKDLIINMDRNKLAEKLIICLDGASTKSDIALNYGLHGCFFDQLSDISPQERQQKMKLVKQAVHSLSREERQKSFTQCVTDQAISYLK